MTKILLPLLLLAGTMPTLAAAQEPRFVIAVSHQDLDLGSAAGVARLDRRIARAIALACPEDTTVEMRRKMALETCRTHAHEEIAAQRATLIARAGQAGATVTAAR